MPDLQLPSLIGREWELAEVGRLLPTTHLLTLVGVGGVENAFGRYEMDLLDRAETDRCLELARQALGKQAAAGAWAEGEAMTVEEAIAYALAEDEVVSDVVADIASAADPLTPREHEIAALVARGWTNGQIAAELVISPATAKRHVENVLSKLALVSRAELASWTTGRQDSGISGQSTAWPAGLSVREAEVLALLADGKSNREIAGELVLSVPTVERHIANIYHKIGVHGRAAATAYALRQGLAPGPEPSPARAAKRHHE